MKEPNQKISNGSATKNCEEHGEYLSEVTEYMLGDTKRFFNSGCPECEKIIQKRQDEEKKREKYREKQNIIKSSGVPKRFLACSFQSYNPQKQSAFNFKTILTYFEKFEEIKLTGTSMILCGKPGTGKTHLACAVVLELIDAGQYVKYTTSYKMLAHIKSTYNKASEELESDVIERYSRCSLLVIDEVGVQFGSESEKVLFYQIINGRYENVLPTILISNLNKNGVRDFIGERCFDRLKEGNGIVLPFDWGSYRK